MNFRSVILLGLLAPLGVYAHDAPKQDAWTPVPFDKRLAHAPRPLPDRIVLTWADDPATTQAVTWRTDTSVRQAVAEFALATDHGPALRPTRVNARTEDLTSDLNEAHYHSVGFTGLQPDTLYAYRVGDGANWSEWFHFRTASREPKPFSFVYFGDAQNDIRTHWSRVFREAFRDAPRAAFTLHAGDLISNDDSDAEWGEWHGAPAWVNATVPVIATPGNHEYFRVNPGPAHERFWTTKTRGHIAVDVRVEPLHDASGADAGERLTARAPDGRTAVLTRNDDDEILTVDAGFTALTGYAAADVVGTETDKRPLRDRPRDPGTPEVSRHWRPQFAFPVQQPPRGLEETCYFIDYQGARIISLDSNRDRAAQAAWLRAVLQENRQRWTILTFHHPMFSPANDRDNPELRELWKPILDEFKVDLVLTGHDHTYARAGLRSDANRNVPSGYNQAYDPAIGTMYVVSVSGPKMYKITHDAFARTAEDTQLYQVIRVDGDILHYEARTATGRLYDAFQLKKRAGGPNELIESSVELPPQRRRPASSAR